MRFNLWHISWQSRRARDYRWKWIAHVTMQQIVRWIYAEIHIIFNGSKSMERVLCKSVRYCLDWWMQNVLPNGVHTRSCAINSDYCTSSCVPMLDITFGRTLGSCSIVWNHFRVSSASFDVLWHLGHLCKRCHPLWLWFMSSYIQWICGQRYLDLRLTNRSYIVCPIANVSGETIPRPYHCHRWSSTYELQKMSYFNRTSISFQFRYLI